MFAYFAYFVLFVYNLIPFSDWLKLSTGGVLTFPRLPLQGIPARGHLP